MEREAQAAALKIADLSFRLDEAEKAFKSNEQAKISNRTAISPFEAKAKKAASVERKQISELKTKLKRRRKQVRVMFVIGLPYWIIISPVLAIWWVLNNRRTKNY